MHVAPLFNQQQLALALALLPLRPTRQRVTGHKHVRPGRPRRRIFLLGKVPVDANDINGLAVEHAVGEILELVDFLRSGDAAADDGDVGAVEPEVEF